MSLLLPPSNGFAQTPDARSLTLEQVVRYAMEHNPDLTRASAEIRRRQGLEKSAKSALLPHVDLFADATKYRRDHGVPPGTEPKDLHFDSTLYAAGAELHVLAWDFGNTSSALEAARLRLDSSRFLADRQREEVIFDVAALFLKALTYGDLIEAGQARQRSLQTLLDQTRQLQIAGRAVPLDVMKVETRLAQVDSDLASLRARRQGALSALAAAMGWEGELPALVAVAPPAPLQPEYDDTLLRKAVASRPDLSAALRESQAAASLVRSAHRSLLPRLDVRAGVYDYGANSPVAFGALIGSILPGLPVPSFPVSHWQADWMVGGRLSFALFDGGKRRGDIVAAQAQEQQAEAVLARTRLAVAREVETSQANLSSDLERVKSLERSVAQAEEALRLERLKYRAGRSEINFVLEAEAALLTHDSLLREARRAVQIDQLAVALSVGLITEDSIASARSEAP